jgi:hypothetical protein
MEMPSSAMRRAKMHIKIGAVRDQFAGLHEQ